MTEKLILLDLGEDTVLLTEDGECVISAYLENTNEWNIFTFTVSAMAKRYGVEVENRKLNGEHRSEIIDAYAKRWNAKNLAAEERRIYNLAIENSHT